MKTELITKIPKLLAGFLICSTPLIGVEELLFEENFEDESRQILATPDNNPDPSTVAAGKYIVIGGRDDGATNMNARRQIGSDGLQVRAGGTLEGDWVFSFQDIDYPGIGPLGSEYAGEGLNDRNARLKFPNIDISGYGNIRVELTIAAGFGAGNEPNDDFYIRTRVDGGEWIEIGGFKAPSSNNVPAYYQGPRDTVTTADMEDRLVLGFFGDWDWPVFGHGSTLEVQLTAEGNAGNEDFHVGEIRVYGDTNVNFVQASFANGEVTEPETGGVSNPLTLTLEGPAPDGGVTFDLIPLDGRSASSLDIPETATVPAGNTSVVVPVDIVQDGQFTGRKIVDLFVTAAGYNSGFARVLVENVTPVPNVRITEVLNVVPGLNEEDLFGDANGDGVYHNTRDQFIEIVNFDDEPVDLTSWRIGDDLADRHLIPEGTILAPNQVLLVFGGGIPQGTFGGAIVQLPSGGGNGLGFNIASRAEIAYLNAPFGAAVDLVNVPLQRDDQIVITEALPDGHAGKGVSASVHATSLDGSFEYGRTYGADQIHSIIDGAQQRLFSPGTWIDGSPYFEPENNITLSVDNDVILETDGVGAATGTISLSNAAPAGGMEVTLETDGVIVHGDGTFSPDEIDLEALVFTVPEGTTEATFSIDAINDGVLDGDQVLSISARGGPYVLSGFTNITVADVAVSDLTVTINEMMTDVTETGTDYNLDGLTDDELGDQFIEIVNTSGRPVNLSNWKVTWDTGGTFAAERLVHVFPQGTWVPDNGAVIVFGRISETAALDPSFGGALVQTAMNAAGEIKKNGLDMRIDSSFDIKLFNEHGFLVEEIVEIAETSINQGMALTRSPDLTGELMLHLEVSPSFQLASPGARLDGTPFGGNGIISIPQTFAHIVEITAEGLMKDPDFGWLAVDSITGGSPWVYSFKHATFWWVWQGSSPEGMWLFDVDIDDWIYTNYLVYPWIYRFSTSEWLVR